MAKVLACFGLAAVGVLALGLLGAAVVVFAALVEEESERNRIPVGER